MGKEFLNNLNIHGEGQIQFKNTAGANAGKIDQDGNNLVLTNAVGDILLGDGSSDVFIGDGTNNVDIIFEQSGAIKGDGSAVTLTLGGANTTLNLENPNINGALSVSNKLTFTGTNGYILFDYEPSTGNNAEYTNEVPLLKVDQAGSEKTVLSRLTNNGALAIGIDDTVAIVAGDTKSVVKSNHNYAAEEVVFSAEGGFRAYGFPNNDVSWSNRNEFRFRSESTTANTNGLYLGDGGSTQFIDISRNLKNIGTISSGAITSSGKLTINTGSDDILTLNQTSTDTKWNYINFKNQGTREWFIGQDSDGNFDLYNDNIDAYAITVNLSNNSILLNDTVTVAQALTITTGDVTLSNGNVIVGSQYGIRFNDANTRIYTNTDTPEDLIIEADQDLLLTPDGQVSITGNANISGTLNVSNNLTTNHVLPVTDSTYNVGSNSVRYANGYFDFVHGDGSNLTNISATDSTKVAKAGDTMTGDLTIDRSGDNISNIHLRRDTNSDSTIIADVNWLSTTAQGTDDRLAIIRTSTQGGTSGSRGGLMSLFTRSANSSGFNQTTFNHAGNWSFPGDISVGGTVDGVDIATRDSVLTSTTTTANAALPKAGGTMTGDINLGSGSASIKKTANTSGNYPAIELYASGTGDSGAAIAIQQATAEGDTIIFADYEPHVEWGISAENGANEIHFTAGSGTNSLGSKTFKNNAGDSRTAYKKMTINLSSGNVAIGGTLAVSGAVTGPTASAGTNTTQLATTAFVTTAVANLIDGAPANLNTLNELAEALNDDDDAIVTINSALGNRVRTDTNQQGLSNAEQQNARANINAQVAGSYLTSHQDISGKLNLSGGTMTGDLVMQDEMINFAAGNPVLPNFRGKRSSTRLNDREWDTEGAWSYTTFENNTVDRPSDGLHNGNGLLTFNTHGGDGTNNYIHQIAMTTNTNKLWHRRKSGTSFGSWEEIKKGDITFASLTSKPTTLAGYGITDAQASGNYITGSGSLSAQDLTDIGNLSGTNTGDQDLSGLMQKTGGTFTGALEIGFQSNTSGTTGTTFLELDHNVGGDISQQQTFIDFKFTDTNANFTPQVRIGAQVGPDNDANSIEKEGAGSFVVYTAPIGSDSSGNSSGLAESMRVSHNGNVTIAGSVTANGTTLTGNQDLSGFVTKASAQTISGAKTFSSNTTFTGNIAVSGTVDGVDVATLKSDFDGLGTAANFASSAFATSTQGTKADNALPKAGGTITGSITLNDDVGLLFGSNDDVLVKFDGNDFITTIPSGSSFMIGTNGGTPHDNGGKADFVVDINANPQISLYSGQVQVGGTDMNWNSKWLYDGGTKIASWDSNIEIFTQGSSGATAKNIFIRPQAANGAVTTVATFNGDNGTTLTGNASVTGNLTLSSTSPLLYLANTTSSTGKTWRFSSASNGKLFITQDGVIDAVTLNHTTGDATFAGDVTVEGGNLELGKADTSSGHINAKELMTFNIDTDNDDTNRYFAWYKDSSSGSGTELLKILETGDATFAGNVGINEASVDAKLHISDGTTPNIKFERPGTKKWAMGISGTDFIIDDVNDNLSTHVLKLAADNTATFAGNIVVSGTVDGVDVAGLKSDFDGLGTAANFSSSAFAPSSTTTTANNALPKSGGTMTGNIAMGENNLTGVGNFTIGGAMSVEAGGDTTVEGAIIAEGGIDITTVGSDLKISDNVKAKFGNGDDLQIYHNNTDSFIDDAGTGDLRIRSNFLKIEKYTGETMATFNDDNAVSLYYNNSNKFQTTNTGVNITGEIEADSIHRQPHFISFMIQENPFSDIPGTNFKLLPISSSGGGTSNFSSPQNDHYFIAPYGGRLKSLVIRNVKNTPTSGPTRVRVYKNGATTATTGYVTPTGGSSVGMYARWTFSSTTTFSQYDRVQMAFESSSSTTDWKSCNATLEIQYDDYSY